MDERRDDPRAPTQAFGQVDQTADPRAFVSYLDTASTQEAVQRYKRQSFALLQPQPGHHLLDIGCGTGDDVRALADLVGPTGRVTGIDSSATMIAEARRRTPNADLPVVFAIGDALALPLPDQSVDGCRADRVWQHLDAPHQALAEMLRVTRSGGRIVVADTDWETVVVDHADRVVTRAIVQAGADTIRNGWMGRQLRGLCLAAGLVDLIIIPGTVVLTDFALARDVLYLRQNAEHARERGTVSAEAATRWLADLEQAGQAGSFFAAISGFIVGGRKPASG